MKGLRGLLKRASVVCHPELEHQKNCAGHRAELATTHASLSWRIISIRYTTQHHPQALTRTPARATSREVRRMCLEQPAAMTLVMMLRGGKTTQTKTERNARVTAGEESQRKENHEVRDAQTSVTEQHVPRRISGKETLSEHPVAVTTQEALDGYREKTMRVAIAENSTFNRVSVSPSGALDMTHCDFSLKSARMQEEGHRWSLLRA